VATDERNNSKLTTMVTMVVRSWRPRTQKREAQAEERGETVLGELVVDEGLSVRILLVLDGRALRPRQRGSRRRPFDQSHLNGRLNGHSNGQPQCAAVDWRAHTQAQRAQRAGREEGKRGLRPEDL